MSECHGHHSWKAVASWTDTGGCEWVEESCEKCGLKHRLKV